MEDIIVELDNVSKLFLTKVRKGLFKSERTTVHALKDVSFKVRRGEVFSLLGPNGAGKTTCIKVLTTLLLPTSGEVEVNGVDVKKNPTKVKTFINAMLMGERSIYWKLTGRQNLEYFGTLYHQSKTDIEQRIEELTKLLKLDEFLDRPVESFSSGQKYKVAFAKALINNPPLVFLDEPTATLDPRSAREMRNVINQINTDGTTIFLTTHNMAEATELSNRVAFIDLGEIIALDTPDNLRHKLNEDKNDSVTITLNKLPEGLVGKIRTIPGIVGASHLPTLEAAFPIIRVITSEDDDLFEILQVINQAKLKVMDMKTETPTLEDVFMELTGRSLNVDTSNRKTAREVSSGGQD